MGRRADARDGVDGQADVAGPGRVGRPVWMPIRTRRSMPSVHACAATPRWMASAALSAEGGPLEGGEELIATGVDLAAPGLPHGRPEQTTLLVQQGPIPIAESVQQLGRALDVGQHEGDLAAWQLLLRPELDADEPERHDPELLGRLQEPHPRPVAVRVVLEADAAEPGERVANVRLVVDRQHPPALRIDVGKGAVREACAILRAERWHLPIIARSIGRRHRSPAVGADGRLRIESAGVTRRRSSSVVEQGTHKPLVGGSNPPSATNLPRTNRGPRVVPEGLSHLKAARVRRWRRHPQGRGRVMVIVTASVVVTVCVTVSV